MSGTGAFVSSLSGYRYTAIGLALVSGALGLASTFADAIEEEGPLLAASPAPMVVPELGGLRGVMAGRVTGR